MTADLPPFHPRRHALERPGDVAFRMSASGETVTFAQLESRANQAAHLFRQHGLVRGDHIVILMENRREFLEICFAADRTGLYYTTASTHLADDEIGYIIEDCGAALVLVSDTLVDRIIGFVDDLRRQCPILVVGQGRADLPSFSALAADAPVTPIADES